MGVYLSNQARGQRQPRSDANAGSDELVEEHFDDYMVKVTETQEAVSVGHLDGCFPASWRWC